MSINTKQIKKIRFCESCDFPYEYVPTIKVCRKCRKLLRKGDEPFTILA
jgi:hypothetical protein